MLDIWVCSTCHSINRERSSKCYKCGAPQSEATGEGAGIRTERAMSARLVNKYRSSLPLAIVACLLLLGLAGMQIMVGRATATQLLTLETILKHILDGGSIDLGALEAAANYGSDLFLQAILLFLATLVGFGAWLAFAVANIPALGGGEYSVSPARAFISAVTPGASFFTVPRHLQQVLYRVDRRGGGIFFVAIAWFGLVGGFIFDRLTNFYFVVRIESTGDNVTTIEAFAADAIEVLQLAGIANVITMALIVAGAIAMTATIIRIEVRAATRNREIRREFLQAEGTLPS
jgi:hypothetical protein